jgi:hypothetical protein
MALIAKKRRNWRWSIWKVVASARIAPVLERYVLAKDGELARNAMTVLCRKPAFAMAMGELLMKTKDQCTVRHRSSKFTFHRSSRMIVAELSELGPQPTGRIWPDAADEGLVIVSEKTGEEATFVHYGDDLTSDGVAVRKFSPTAETVRRLPAIVGWKLHLLND